jgi:trk system potassium uptake protein TrkH
MMAPGKACWYAIFHSASAFANAGLSLFDQSFEPFFQKPALLNTISIIMLLGSIGFVTLAELLYSFPALVGRKIYYYTLESKIIWITATLLLSITCFLFFFLELHTVFATTPLMVSLSNTLFNALSAMGTGFTSIHPLMLKPTTLLVIMAVAFIGTSPGSTGSGIHTTTAAILVATIKAILLKRKQVFLLGKKITQAQIYKATAIIALGISWVMLSTFMLTITDPDHDFLGLFFEAVSAFATLGISLDITPHLSILGKIVIMLSMIFGRLGPLTIFFAIKDSVIHDAHDNTHSRTEQDKNNRQIPE